MKSYKVIGLMSGSSLDGVDLAYCEFRLNDEAIDFDLLIAETIPFDEKWMGRLQHLPTQNALTFAKTHVYFGHYLGELLNDFIERCKIEPDFIASHGHTIFHDPDRRFTTQIGEGGAMAAITKTTVISDFRTQDIAIDGEGTPIAPAADRYLFSEYDLMMNIGGIANITCNAKGKYIAFDTSAANQVLNVLASFKGLEYDKNGNLAAQGKVIPSILEQLESMEYFKQSYPKSIANSWVRDRILPIFIENEASIEDRLHTAVEHIATETAVAIKGIFTKEKLPKKEYQLLVTGGGALNGFLIKKIQEKLVPLRVKVEVPAPEIIEYKEAILMGLMGVLRMEERVNCFSSVTGARRNTIGGAVYLG
ncbi:MAG: anhydro-N-acetylmuramic acid kinase [Saprospiraceae bacterium]